MSRLAPACLLALLLLLPAAGQAGGGPAAPEGASAIAGTAAGGAQEAGESAASPGFGERLGSALSKLENRLVEVLAWLPLLAVALVVFALFWWLGGLVYRRQRLFSRFSANPFVQDLLRQIVRLAILLVGALLALEILEVTALVGALLGTAGVLGLAVGFAFRDLAENYIASVLLSLRQPFAPNDFIAVDGREGKVIRLTSRATVLMTLDGNHLRIPNSQVFKGVILNYSRNPLRRFDFAVGLGTGEDCARAQALGLAVLAGVDGVLAEPAPLALLEGLGESTVDLRFYAWVDQRLASFAVAKSEAIRRVKEAFDQAGIEMPEPIYRLRVEGDLPREGVEQAPRPVRPPPSAPGPAPALPPSALAAGDAIDRQIADERAASGEEDLLDAAARQE